MAKVRKSRRAAEDLVAIWTYSYERWGEARAESYFDELDSAIRLLGSNPELGRRCDEVRLGYRAIRVNRHVVYYTVDPSSVLIVRVLHERMDPNRRL